MTTAVHTGHRPEAMADVPGVCELPLTGAVIQYRERHELSEAGGDIRSIGLALVLDGEYAASAEAVDLGSGEVKVLDLGAELVILDWVYEPTLEHVRELVDGGGDRPPPDPAGGSGGDGEGELERYCFRVALSVIERLGYTPLTRSTILRIGFRDIARDLDFHDTTSVRVVVKGEVVRVRLDYDGNALLFDHPGGAAVALFEETLRSAFPRRDLRRAPGPGGTVRYQVRFPLPHTLSEARSELDEMREGCLRLFAAFEPERHEHIRRALEAFGPRKTLSHLSVREPLEEARLLRDRPPVGSTLVH